MDIKDALQYAVELSEPRIIDVNGIKFSDKPLHEVRREPSPIKRPAPPTIIVKTLSGLADLVKAEECRRWPMMYVIVESPSEVNVITDPREDETRVPLFTAKAVLPTIVFEKFMDMESMIIMLRSRFVLTDNTKDLLKLIGSIKEEAVRTFDDDGVGQAVVARTGIGTKGLTPVEPIQKLAPYRTFVEVDQPESEFLFRLQSGAKDGMGPTMGLFEADGGMWRNRATINVADLLMALLTDIPNVKVIQ